MELIVIKLFDLHCDTLTECFERKTDLSDSSLAVNCTGAKCFENYVQTFAVWISEKDAEPVDKYRKVLKYGKKALRDGGFEICTKASRLDSALKTGKPAALLSLEGGAGIKSLEFLDELYSDGVRTVSLTWNYNNHLAGGALEDGGLTDFGRAVIRRINELGLVLDLSHLNRKSFFGAAELAERIVATHSGLTETVDHRRNLDREQLEVIKQKNGLLGLCFYPVFLGLPVFESFKNAVFDLLDGGFERIMAIGSDFDGADMAKELSSLSDVPTLYDHLCLQNISKHAAERLFFINSYEFYTRVLTNG